MIKFKSDIDIDFADREQALALLDLIPASIIKDGQVTKHNTGAYATDIPRDPFTGFSSLDYKSAEDRGYMKLDLLNVNVYKNVRDEQHLVKLMREPDWSKLRDRTVCEQLIHINNHYDTMLKMPEPVDSIPRLAMFLSVIRPAKRSLIGKSWKEVAETVWQKPTDETYYFKQAHAVSYAQLVVVNLNLLCEQELLNDA